MQCDNVSIKRKIEMKNVVKVALIAASVTLASVAHAQFPNPFGGGAASGGGVSGESVVKNYVEGAKSVLQAQDKLLQAIGKKEEAAKSALQATNLTQGATKQNLEDAAKTQTENSKVLEDGLNAKGATLDAAGKVLYAQGLSHLGTGVTKYIALIGDLKNFKPSVSSLGSAAQGAAYVAQTLPGNMGTFSSTLSHAVNFGKAQGVEIPADATAALK